jgi:hypothetical protein
MDSNATTPLMQEQANEYRSAVRLKIWHDHAGRFPWAWPVGLSRHRCHREQPCVKEDSV